jgi:hypothetical protein
VEQLRMKVEKGAAALVAAGPATSRARQPVRLPSFTRTPVQPAAAAAAPGRILGGPGEVMAVQQQADAALKGLISSTSSRFDHGKVSQPGSTAAGRTAAAGGGEGGIRAADGKTGHGFGVINGKAGSSGWPRGSIGSFSRSSTGNLREQGGHSRAAAAAGTGGVGGKSSTGHAVVGGFKNGVLSDPLNLLIDDDDDSDEDGDGVGSTWGTLPRVGGGALRPGTNRGAPFNTAAAAGGAGRRLSSSSMVKNAAMAGAAAGTGASRPPSFIGKVRRQLQALGLSFNLPALWDPWNL